MVVKDLIKELRQAIGQNAVKTAKEDLESYTFDATPDMPTGLPDVVVIPESTDHVQAIVTLAKSTTCPFIRAAPERISAAVPFP